MLVLRAVLARLPFPHLPLSTASPAEAELGCARSSARSVLTCSSPQALKVHFAGDRWHDRVDLGSPEPECRAELYLCAFCATCLGWVLPFSGPQGLHLHEVGWIIALRRPLMTPTVCLSWVNLPQLEIKERTSLCVLISF